jgi:E3 ubiquitin-protein ligase HUWE1
MKKFASDQRPQQLMLRDEFMMFSEKPEVKGSDEPKQTDQGTAEGSLTDQVEPALPDNEADEQGLKNKAAVKASTEPENENEVKPKHAEIKPPVVMNPDGVIHYLLCELLSYKDVPDKEPVPVARDVAKETSNGEDTEMADSPGASSSDTPTASGSTEQKKTEKPEFKAEEHPIYIYRCFILQCLTELLSSYNRAKVEFINFSRKAPPQVMTPSKPRSGVLNYLLNDLIPVGTLNHAEDVPSKKKFATSQWAGHVVTALVSKTAETGWYAQLVPDDEDDNDLVFVRKFVLEHILKAYKETNSLNEPLDAKYARLLCLTDLLHRMLTTRTVSPNQTHPDPQRSPLFLLARLMYEKNFIAALTASIADIDLNFPNAKRAVKYILKPLRILTSTALDLTEDSTVSTTPGQTDEDEISTASTVSDLDDEREETPDLFRNSTLGMLEPGREDETSLESEDGKHFPFPPYVNVIK